MMCTPHSERRRLLIALLSAACSGCSFAFVSGPPSGPSDVPPRPGEPCTTSVLYPVLDSVGAAVGAVNIGIASAASPGKVAWYGVEMESETGLALGVTQLALFGAGAIYGFVQTSRCNAYLEETRKEPEGGSWSPALAPENRPPSVDASEAPGSQPRAAVPSTVQPSPAAVAAPPAPSAAPVTTSDPHSTSSPPRVPTAAFPD